MERRFLSVLESGIEIEERQGEPIKFVGYAARFYDGTPGTEFELYKYRDNSGREKRIVERIAPTAFDRMMADGDDVRLLFNHDPNMLLARRSSGTLTLSVFPNKGLRYIGTAGDTSIARDLQQHIRRGDVSGSSFSFIASRDDEEWATEGDTEIRTIHNFSAVYDVGPVSFPSYTSTSAGMRAVSISNTMTQVDKHSWNVQFDSYIPLVEQRFAQDAMDSHIAWQKRIREREAAILALSHRALQVRAIEVT